jgi:hypothetical protein
MTQKSKKETTESLFEREIKEMIRRSIEEEYPQMIEKDIKDIIEYLMPDLDKLISKKVKMHLVEVAKHIIKTYEK